MKNYFIDSDKIVWRNIDGEAIILNLDTGFYYSLNKIGTIIWQMLNEKKKIPQIIEAMCRDYNNATSKIGRDIEFLIKDLSKEGLLNSKLNK